MGRRNGKRRRFVTVARCCGIVQRARDLIEEMRDPLILGLRIGHAMS